MYGILVRLEASGWLTIRLDHATERATPPRRFYRLTDYGAREAADAVARTEGASPYTRLATDRAGSTDITRCRQSLLDRPVRSRRVDQDPDRPTVDSHTTALILRDQDLLFLCHVCAIFAILNHVSAAQIDEVGRAGL